MKLYDYLPSGNSYKVRLMMSYLGLRYTHVPIDIVQGESQTDAFKAVNPVGQIPLLELDDGRRIAESNAIIYFLGEGTPYWPKNAFDQAKCLQWMFFEQYKHEPSISVARYIRHYDMESRAQELPKLTERGYSALDVMETHLEQEAWFAGGSRSLADIALYAYTHVAGEGGFDLTRYPNITAWLARFADSPKHILITDKPA